MDVSYLGGKKFKAEFRNHSILIDLPKDFGGEDSAMMPPELLIASLGSCIGVYAVNFLENAGLDASGLAIKLDWQKESQPSRISKIQAEVAVPNAQLDKRKAAFLKVIEHCTVHNTLSSNPGVQITLKEKDEG